MKWLKPSKCVEKSNWHFWFAWYWVCVRTWPDGTEKIVWFEKVLRKGKRIQGWEGVEWQYTYKEIL